MNSFHEKMYEKINRYSKSEYLDGFIKDEFLTDDGDADIFLNVNSSNELFDSRGVGKQRVISDDIYKFVEDKTSMLDNDVQIHLHIMGVDLAKDEQEEFKHIFKEHYAIELYKVQKKYINVRRKILGLLLFGFLSFALYGLFYFFLDFDFFLEVFCFLFTFSLWEALDCIIYSFRDIKNTREEITQNLLIIFSFDFN